MYSVGESVQYIYSLLYVLGKFSQRHIAKDYCMQAHCLACAPPYSRGVVQDVVFDRFGLARPHECISKAATCHANSTV